jgi:hypothetical protein
LNAITEWFSKIVWFQKMGKQNVKKWEGGRERRRRREKTSVTKQSGRCRIVDGMQSRIQTGLGH